MSVSPAAAATLTRTAAGTSPTVPVSPHLLPIPASPLRVLHEGEDLFMLDAFNAPAWVLGMQIGELELRMAGGALIPLRVVWDLEMADRFPNWAVCAVDGVDVIVGRGPTLAAVKVIAQNNLERMIRTRGLSR